MADFLHMRVGNNMVQGLHNLIKHINNVSPTNNMRMLEIGSYLGESTLIFADHFKEVITIDPFLENYDPNDETCKHAPLSEVHKQFLKNIEPYKNIKHIRKTSDDAVVDIKDQIFDFIYIDGLHTYNQVKKDIANYSPYVKDGGFIGGHDYHPNFKEVVDGVNESLKVDKVFEDTSWIKHLNNE
jgi:predicted O-methyltransferase YrrM